MAESQRMRELERLLQQSELRAQDAERGRQDAERGRQDAERGRQDAERGRQEADRERQEAERRFQEVQRQRQEDEMQTRPTTLNEFLTACHDTLFCKFRIEPDPSLQSKGGITSPLDKWCPTSLEPWSDFLDGQRRVFGLLFDTYPADTRTFESQLGLSAIGNILGRRTIADEKGLESFLHISVEDPVRVIIDKLKHVDEAQNAFRLGGGIIFENHVHAISDISDEVLQLDGEEAPMPPSTPGQGLDLNQLRPDQICVYRSDDSASARRIMAYVLEYKPPHKLLAQYLRLALRGSMDIHADVVNRKMIPDSEDPEFAQYSAEKLTASAVTQTYHYMIEGGLEYGLLTTGEMIVFLKINWDKPGTLLYHLAEPSAETIAHPVYSYLCSAVGQHLAFSLVALGSSVHVQEHRQRAKASLRTWSVDFETTLRSLPESSCHASDMTFSPVDYAGVDRSPFLFRRPRRVATPDPPMGEQVHRDPRDPSDDDDAAPDTPSPEARRSSGGTRRSRRIMNQRSRGDGGQGSTKQTSTAQGSTKQESTAQESAELGTKQQGNAEHGTKQQGSATTGPWGVILPEQHYCTQKCLLGLVRGGLLDKACPNIALHTGLSSVKKRAQTRHGISHAQFRDLIYKQLEHSLDDGIAPLPQGGARGVLFKVTLLAYGYTFVAKGTVRVFVKCLEHEAAVYERLEQVQGVHVPVLLGAVDLRPMNKIYYFDHRVYIIYMMFMSWGGDGIRLADLTDTAEKHLTETALRSLHAIHSAGVVHKDIRAPNMLSNAETNGVMVIDFERALILEPPRLPLAQVVASKRNRKPESTDAGPGKLVERSRKRPRVADVVRDEAGRVKLIFKLRRSDFY